MKKIIAAIDFSKGSLQALEYACVLARKISASITMVWVDSEHQLDILDNKSKDLRDYVIRNFKELMSQYKPTGVVFDYKMRKGKVYQELAFTARQIEADFIVAGTHGVTGFEEYWIGSNAYRIVSYAPCPVITLRFDFKSDNSFNDIVLPIDSTAETRQKIAPACQMALALGSRIHIIGLQNTTLRSLQKKTLSNMEFAVKQCQESQVPHQAIEIHADNVTRAVINYAESIHAALIAIMTEQQSRSSSLLLGPQAEQIVNYSPIPVLSIHPKEIKSMLNR